MADVFEIENFNLKLLDVPKLNIKIFHTMCTFKVTNCDLRLFMFDIIK